MIISAKFKGLTSLQNRLRRVQELSFRDSIPIASEPEFISAIEPKSDNFVEALEHFRTYLRMFLR